MLAKSKIKKLKTDLKKFKTTNDEMESVTGVSRQYVWLILNAKKYNRDVVLKLVELRNKKILELNELEIMI